MASAVIVVDEMLEVIPLATTRKSFHSPGWIAETNPASSPNRDASLPSALMVTFCPRLGKDTPTFFLVEDTGSIAEIDIRLVATDHKILFIHDTASVLNAELPFNLN